jgi:outer membrane protein assembly factor BamB
VTAFADNGQGVRWEQTVLERRNLSAPAVVGSYVVVADFEGYLHALSQVDGSMAARTRVDSDGVRADMVVANGMLIVFGNSGKVVAYKLEEKSSGFFSG